jgi:predicted phosphodiesterase
MSDLHLEFTPYVPPRVDADLVILAGDVGKEDRGILWAAKHFTMPVIYVCGNHEFYSRRPMQSIRHAIERAAAKHGIHYLERGRVDLGHVRILGATIWTDLELYERADIARGYAYEMNDFCGAIAVSDPYDLTNRLPFTPDLSVSIHRASVNWLEAELANPWPGKTVVVTHHAPSMRSVSMRFLGDQLNPCYASRLEHVAEKADYWIHGHMHDSCAYEIGKCRVICNPRGYSDIPENPEAAFNPELVIEV